MNCHTDYGRPSGHAMISIPIIFSVPFVADAKTKKLFPIILIGLIGFARIYSGGHSFS
jgi:membrane-associated phospholipid phosphatase